MSQWQRAVLISSRDISQVVKSLVLEIDQWQPHLCGQFYDVSVDGGKTSRCYSVASAPEDEGRIELGVEILANGVVSPRLHALAVGEAVLVSGPHGLPVFTWSHEMSGPLVLIGGGSGMVPLMSMIRHYVAHRDTSSRSVTVISSARDSDHLVYHDDIMAFANSNPEIVYIPIATQDEKWQGRRERIDAGLLESVAAPTSQAYVCGSFGFVSEIGALLEQQITISQIHREYFG